jgi:hypothetical protein
MSAEATEGFAHFNFPPTVIVILRQLRGIKIAMTKVTLKASS